MVNEKYVLSQNPHSRQKLRLLVHMTTELHTIVYNLYTKKSVTPSNPSPSHPYDDIFLLTVKFQTSANVWALNYTIGSIWYCLVKYSK